MINNFTLLKLNRSIWVSLLEQEKIVEAINYFESYINNLMSIKTDKKFQQQAEAEIGASEVNFLLKMTELADKYFENEDYPNALICYTALFKYCQDNIEVIKNYSTCLEKLYQFDLAASLLEYLETTVPEDVSVYKFLAEIHDKKKDYKKSAAYLQKYVDNLGEDTSVQDYNLLGCYYNKLYTDVKPHRIEDAIKSYEYFKKSYEMDPYTKVYAKNATILACKVNDIEGGKFYWDKVFEMGKITNDDKYDYAAFCLRNSDFAGWHRYFGSRFQKETGPTPFPALKKSQWNGEKDLSNSTLLVYFEQGFGDTFLMWGYMPRLVKMAKHVIFVVQDAIHPLLMHNDLGVEVLAKSLVDLNKLKYDYYIPAMQIPVALKLTRENISVGEGFIKVRPELVQEFKEKYFNNDKLKIGISFAGSPNGNHFRDIGIEEFLPLDKLKNVEIYSLTKDIPDSKFECFKKHQVNNIAKSFRHFEDTAAAMMNLDIVIASDNCILNLAGALGKKTYGLFNWHYEFRWFDLTGDDVVWLTSVKPFVNDKIDNWAYSMNKVIKELDKK